METALVAGDFQIPCHDPSALEVFMQIGEDLKPDVLVINGDFVEFRNISLRFPARRDEKWGLTAREEIITASGCLKEIVRRIKPKKKKFNEGNHEWRLFRVMSQIPQVLEILNLESVARAVSMEEILGLSKLGFIHSGEYPKGCWLFNRKPENNVFVHHSWVTRKKAGYAAHADIEGRGVSTITGHGERMAMVFKRFLDKEVFAIEGGNLSIIGEPGKGDGIYGSVPFSAPEMMDHKQGFSIVTLDGNDCFPEIVPIKNGKAVWRGKVYKP